MQMQLTKGVVPGAKLSFLMDVAIPSEIKDHVPEIVEKEEVKEEIKENERTPVRENSGNSSV